MKKLVKSSFLICIFLGIATGEEVAQLAVPIRPNNAWIIAQVISVEKQIFPETKLTLKVIKSFSETINLSTGTVFSPSVEYRRDEASKVILTDESNQKNFVIYYLLPNDIVSAEVSLHGDEYGKKWWMRNIERLPLRVMEEKE